MTAVSEHTESFALSRPVHVGRAHLVVRDLETMAGFYEPALGLKRFEEIGEDIGHLHARNPHELMRAAEVSVIRDCAEMAARASLFRTESRWGLYHLRVDYPERNDADWFCHAHLYKDAQGRMAHVKREIEPYIVPIDDTEKTAYDRLRISRDRAQTQAQAQAVPAAA